MIMDMLQLLQQHIWIMSQNHSCKWVGLMHAFPSAVVITTKIAVNSVFPQRWQFIDNPQRSLQCNTCAKRTESTVDRGVTAETLLDKQGVTKATCTKLRTRCSYRIRIFCFVYKGDLSQAVEPYLVLLANKCKCCTLASSAITQIS